MPFTSVDVYINSFPHALQVRLHQLRQIILQEAPSATESISYGMPAYKLNSKPLVYFAAFTHHIGFYATPTGHSAFSKELAAYKQGKGSVQFPLADPLPLDLIARIVRFRAAQNSTQTTTPKRKK